MNRTLMTGALLCGLLGVSAAGACTTKVGRMFNGRVAALASFDRECGYAWQTWKRYPDKGRKLLRWAEMWSADARESKPSDDLQALVDRLGYTPTKKTIGSTAAVFPGNELYLKGPGQSFLLIELFFVGDRVNVLLGGN